MGPLPSVRESTASQSAMQKLCVALIQVLEQQLVLYGRVRDLLTHEREALISGRPDIVFDLVRRKETILMEIRTIDESRRLICMRIGKQIGANGGGSLTLSDIIDAIEDETCATRLIALRRSLRDELESLRLLNSKTATVCDQGLETIHQIAESVAQHGDSPDTQSYGPRSERPAKRYGSGGYGGLVGRNTIA